MHRSTHFKNKILAAVVSVLVFLFLAGFTDAAAQIASHHMHMTSSATATKTFDIVRDPADVPSPIGSRGPAVVHVELTAKEVTGVLDASSGTTYRYWTFNGKVPAPMIRVRQGDTVQVTLHNDRASHMAHSVDFHAALGPGGGAAFSQAMPGESKTFTFQATTPGLFVYHCGTPMIAEHIANGMYGLILVEPPSGLPHVGHEYYVMQGEIYTAAPKGKAGLQQFSDAKLLAEDPEYFIFNGAVDALTKQHPLRANVGDIVRIFFGDAGPNKPSSLHVVGEIFTQEYVAGSVTTAPLTNVQTAIVAPGSAAILQLKAVEPGQFNFMDHAMARMAKGLMATLDVAGAENATLMHAGPLVANPSGNLASTSVSGMTAADSAAVMTAMKTEPASITTGSELITPRSHASKSSYRSKILQATDSARGGTRSKEADLNGCLTWQNDGATLKSWPSNTTYALQAMPLQFAGHANQLVHLRGYFGSVVPTQLSSKQFPTFVADTVEELAAGCNVPITRELLKKAASGELAADVSGPIVNVGMGDMAFVPAKITIKAGQKVVWKNSSTVIHNVVDDAGKAMNKADVQLPVGINPFASELLQPGQTYGRVFAKPGTYRYVCTLHEGAGMKGVIVVK